MGAIRSPKFLFVTPLTIRIESANFSCARTAHAPFIIAQITIGKFFGEAVDGRANRSIIQHRK